MSCKSPIVDNCDGDGFVTGPDGIPRWGLYGAAGLLLRHTDEQGVTRYLLAERSRYVMEPGTRAFPGGALRRGEAPEAGALREAEEEFAAIPPHTVAEVIVDRPPGAGAWFYATVVADVDRDGVRVTDSILEPTTWENTGACRWVTPEEATRLPLHPGVAGLLGRLLGQALR